MADDKITLDSIDGFEKDAYIRIAGGPWWKTYMRIVEIDSPTCVTVQWEWWREPWFQIPVIYGLIWANFTIWADWGVSQW